MTIPSPTERAEALLAAPAGCALLVLASENGLTAANLADPDTAHWLVAEALRLVSPWNGDGHDRVVAKARSLAAGLIELASDIASHPGIAWMWAPIDRARQLWLPGHDAFICPEEVWELRPRIKPSDFEVYVHAPRPEVTTSDWNGTLSSELAVILAGASDRNLPEKFSPRRVTIRQSARVLEIVTPQDWHAFTRRYPHPAPIHDDPHPDWPNHPWGNAPGMIVPNWTRVANNWDGVHVTPWALLTATQVRVCSETGWTEPWAWDGAHTTWLNWVFDAVEEMPDVRANQLFRPPYASTHLAIHDPEPMPGFAFATTAGVNTMTDTSIASAPFGMFDGQPVESYTLTNETGIRATILTYGGIIKSLEVPDRHGNLANVVLGYDSLDGYTQSEAYFGALVGRFGNRIANGTFTLDGQEYTLAINNGPNALHGGLEGFNRRIWRAETLDDSGTPGVRLKRTSPDGEEGFPGTLEVAVTYRLIGNRLVITYEATTDAPTVLNLTNHSYFNLAGEGSGSILRHVLQMRASQFTPVSESLIPTGELAPVEGTPFDFTEAHVIGERIDAPGNRQLANAGGYDHNFVFDRADEMPFAPDWLVRVVDPGSGRVLDLQTDQLGVQFYTANFLDGSQVGPSGRSYAQHAGFCLETQHFPDSPNRPDFPSTVLRPGKTFHSQTSYGFGITPNPN